MDLNSIFSTNNKAQTIVKQGSALVSNTMLVMNKNDLKNFTACVYGYDSETKSLYLKLTNDVAKNEKHSTINGTKIRLNISKGLGLDAKANKVAKLETVKGQTNTYKLALSDKPEKRPAKKQAKKQAETTA